MEVVARIIILLLTLGLPFVWIHALVNYDPDERHCDWDCDSCPFPSKGCRELEKKPKQEDENHE